MAMVHVAVGSEGDTYGAGLASDAGPFGLLAASVMRCAAWAFMKWYTSWARWRVIRHKGGERARGDHHVA